MNKYICTVLLLWSGFAFADTSRIPLDETVFQVSAKQWVSTQTALLTVNVNATLSNADLVKARADIMARLSKIASGEWHLTQFDRSQDSSGLEKLFVEAQARVSQSALTNIYKNAKDVSQPGASYTVTAVEFKPDLVEIQQIKSQIRQKLYTMVNEELDRLNKTYPSQHYTVNRLYIIDGDAPAPMAKAYEERQMAVMAAAPAPNLAVSNELTMSAVVTAASNRQRSVGSATD